MYNAVVTKLTNVKAHPNADRLQIAQALGYTVIVGMNVKEGDLGIAFPEGGCITPEFALPNSLYRKHPDTNEPMGGFFEPSGRIKALKLRGEISDCFWTPISSLDFLGKNSLKEGDEVNTVNGVVICKKYFTPATLQAMKKAKQNYKKPKWLPNFLVPMHKKYKVWEASFDPCPTFNKVGDTNQLRMHYRNIPENAIVYFSSKKHGTSGRTGRVQYIRKGLFSRLFGSPKYTYVSGTRNVVLNPYSLKDKGFYAGTDFREKAHNLVIKNGLKNDEIVYYEILGYTGEGKVMPDHKMVWEDFKKSGFSKEEFEALVLKYGETVTYLYGCKSGEFKIEVYRITQNGVDLTQDQMAERCKELGLDTVKLLETSYAFQTDFMAKAKELSDLEDEGGQLREGVCLRLEVDGKFTKIYKYKSSTFCVLEGIRRNDVNYVDMEEVS